MKINFHETDPMEAESSFPKDSKGIAMVVEPAFYGKSKSAMVCVVTSTSNNGKWLHRYRLKATDTGKLVLEDLGEPRKLDVDTPALK
jgi:hypothetical protein